MNCSAKTINYSNLTTEDQQIIQAQLLMIDAVEDVISNYTFPEDEEDNLLEKLSLQEGLKALLEAKEAMYREIIEYMIFAICEYDHDVEEIETNDYFYGLYPTEEEE